MHDFIRLHAFHQAAHALCVAVAASIELHIVDDPVVDFKFDHLATGTLRIIGMFHFEIDLAAKVTLILQLQLPGFIFVYLLMNNIICYDDLDKDTNTAG